MILSNSEQVRLVSYSKSDVSYAHVWWLQDKSGPLHVAVCSVPGGHGQEIIMSHDAVSLIKGIRTQLLDSRKEISLSVLDRPKFAKFLFLKFWFV